MKSVRVIIVYISITSYVGINSMYMCHDFLAVTHVCAMHVGEVLRTLSTGNSGCVSELLMLRKLSILELWAGFNLAV